MFSLSQRPTILEIHNLYKTKVATVSQVVKFFYNRIQSLDPKIKAIVRRNEEKAFAKSSDLDEILANTNTDQFDDLFLQYPLFGIPFLLKDNILVEGLEVTSQSRILEGYIAPYSSDVFVRLDKAGAVLLAQTNMDEFAFGSSTEFSGFGQVTHNPNDLDRVAGGTSGGSAAAVAAGMTPFALGTDTGGSVRQPSSFCGTVGLRPTYGFLPRYGIMASTSSFDQPGPIANTAADALSVFNVLAGDKKSEHDQTNLNPILDEEKQTIRVGIPKEVFGEGLSIEVREAFELLIEKLGKKYQISEVSLSLSPKVLSVYYILQTVEASANLERFDGVRFGKQFDDKIDKTDKTNKLDQTISEIESDFEMFFSARKNGFGDETKRRIMLGTYTSSAGYYDAYYNKACQVRELMRREYAKVFEQVDVLLMPTAPTPAFKIGENSEDPMAMYLADIMTVSHPIVRAPGLVIPFAKVNFEGSILPVGAQLVGPELSEKNLFKLAEEIEKYAEKITKK